MIFEHFALNVPDAKEWAAWYTKNCGMKVLRSMAVPPYTHFLADSTSRMVVEVYSNPEDPIPDYSNLHPLRFHFAFAVNDPNTIKEKLIQAGASFVKEDRPEEGSLLIMLRDPWGIPLQLCSRKNPMI